MDSIALLPAQRRAVLCTAVAAQLGIANPEIIEKDFWVCWSLQHLFARQLSAEPDNTAPWPPLLFKGGTSLSKVFGIVDRFSEDVDLSFDHRDLGFDGIRDPDAAGSGKHTKRLLDELEETTVRYVADQLLPALRRTFAAVLGNEMQAAGSWHVRVASDDPQTIEFHYPVGVFAEATPGLADSYVRPQVRLEFGSRSKQWPMGRHTLRSHIADVFPNLLASPEIPVIALEAERTFWDKVVLLHKEYHRPVVRAPGRRLARHYYDLAMMAEHPIGHRALENRGLLTAVVNHTARYFRTAWANYTAARPGTLRLVPHKVLRAALEEDYLRMRPMFLHDPPPFHQLIERIRDLETVINHS